MQGYDFGGSRIFIPGPYVDPSYPESPDLSVGGARKTVIVGSAEGGVPHNATVDNTEFLRNKITSIPQAFNLLVGGDGYYGVEFFMSPTKDPRLRVPSEVYFVRVDPAIQSTGAVRDTGDAADVIDLKSGRYGAASTLLATKITAGSNFGYKVEVSYKGSPVLEKDDVGYKVFEIQYVGAGSAATMTVNATQLTTTVTGATGDNLTIDFSTIKTLGELVDQINQHAAYTCKLKYDRDLASTVLDAVSAQDILTAAYVHSAHVEAVIDALNRETYGEVIAALSTGASRSGLKIDSGFVYLTGGSNGTITNTEWINALALLENFKDIDHVVILSGDATIHNLSSTHVNEMSKVKVRKNRRCFSGALASKTLAEKQDESIAINDARFDYCYSKFKRRDVIASEVVEFAPYFGACLIAGIRNSSHVTMAATFKNLNIVDTEVLKTEDEEAIIRAGGTYFKKDGNEFEVGHNISTYQGSGSKIFQLPSMMDTTDFITKDTIAKMKGRMKSFDRAPNDAMWSELENYLNTAVFPAYETAGLITANPNNDEPSFTPVTITVDGDVFKIRTKLIIPAPGNYGFISYEFATVSSISDIGIAA